MAAFTRTNLNNGWEFKQVGAVGIPDSTDDFLPVAQFSMNILDLMAHSKIPDPFVGLNEYKVQWVGEQKWWYRTSFEIESIPSDDENVVLQFDGLDTFASVSLNDKKILEAENIHRTFRVHVNGTVKRGRNELEILFDSAIIKGRN
jgi:beta-mannosidase